MATGEENIELQIRGYAGTFKQRGTGAVTINYEANDGVSYPITALVVETTVDFTTGVEKHKVKLTCDDTVVYGDNSIVAPIAIGHAPSDETIYVEVRSRATGYRGTTFDTGWVSMGGGAPVTAQQAREIMGLPADGRPEVRITFNPMHPGYRKDVMVKSGEVIRLPGQQVVMNEKDEFEMGIEVVSGNGDPRPVVGPVEALAIILDHIEKSGDPNQEAREQLTAVTNAILDANRERNK